MDIWFFQKSWPWGWVKKKKKISNKHDWSGSNNVFGVFSQKNFFGTKTPPLVDLNPKIIFSQKPLKTRFEHFLGGFIWFCVLEKKNIFLTSQSKVKNFLYFFGRFELPKCKVWVFFGVLIFNFWSTMGLTICSQGQFNDPNSKK